MFLDTFPKCECGHMKSWHNKMNSDCEFVCCSVTMCDCDGYKPKQTNKIVLGEDGSATVENKECPDCGKPEIGGIWYDARLGKLMIMCNECQAKYDQLYTCKHENADSEDRVCPDCGRLICWHDHHCDNREDYT